MPELPGRCGNAVSLMGLALHDQLPANRRFRLDEAAQIRGFLFILLLIGFRIWLLLQSFIYLSLFQCYGSDSEKPLYFEEPRLLGLQRSC